MSFIRRVNILRKHSNHCLPGMVLLLTIASIALLFGFTPIFAQDVIFLKPINGSDAYAVAGVQDPGFRDVEEMATADPSIRKAVLNYKRVQLEAKLSLKKNLEKQGMDAQTIELLMANYPVKPVYFVLDQGQGSNFCSLGSIKIIDEKSGAKVERVLKDTPAVHLSMNGQTMKRRDRGDISRSISHELAHGAMGIAYGSPSRMPKSDYFGKPHWRGMVSDRAMALVEGWAEANGPYFSGDARFMGPLEENVYSLKDDGTLKSYDEMMRTEGFVSTLFYNIISGRSGIDDGYDKLMTLFAKGSPSTFEELALSFMDTYPADASRMLELFISLTGGACVSDKCSEMYAGLLTGRISPVEYSKWLDSLKTGNMGNFRKTLAAGAAAGGKGPDRDQGGFSDSRRGGRVSDAQPFWTGASISTDVRRETISGEGLKSNSDPYGEYLEMVRKGLRNTPEAREALKKAMETSRLQAVEDSEAAREGDDSSVGSDSKLSDVHSDSQNVAADRSSERIGSQAHGQNENTQLRDRDGREEIEP
ncbi:MAG: hypothetical protein CVV64_08755 [Candidatus Wallbacteria bacterium HGW-Wallbacteria-1]|uniref:Uncharacterized protein n=1 Tax=Candidatus Wallbacteria bacterium HGW-Wallbacteria-1 TaxID=2013854 RepID=A0A2N1PQ34_9BACT|nr:MAG: hypothetical protein CVV64_08755 [Candidatus Wallbacteria bacterium HGW-Wallbacteria-1]